MLKILLIFSIFKYDIILAFWYTFFMEKDCKYP